MTDADELKLAVEMLREVREVLAEDPDDNDIERLVARIDRALGRYEVEA